MLGPGQLSDKIIYYQPQLVSPAETGFPTISAYLQSLFNQGYRATILSVVNFDELQVKDWGYGILAYAGESQYVWNVELFRSIGNERYYRQLNAGTGIWITDHWSKYITDDDITLGDVAGAYGENGVNFDFNLINRTFIDMTGNFSMAKNAPPGFYGDGSLTSSGHNQIVTQYDGNRMWYRTASYDRSIWNQWKDINDNSSATNVPEYIIVTMLDQYIDSPRNNAVYWKQTDSVVHLTGRLQMNDASMSMTLRNLFQLNEDYRPAQQIERPVNLVTFTGNIILGAFTIATDGLVRLIGSENVRYASFSTSFIAGR